MGWILAVLLSSSGGEPALQKFQATEIHMGSSFTVVLYAEDQAHATRALAAAFARIRRLDETLSDYKEDSELSRLSAQAPTTRPVPVSDELWKALETSDRLARLTDGAFDVTVGPLTRLWRRSRRQRELPTPERLASALAATGHTHLRLHRDSMSVELRRPDMRLDMGGIGQGLAADAAIAELRKAGAPRALINASGDILAGDPPPGEVGWKIGIAPLDPSQPPQRFVWLANAAISTSGDAYQYVEIDGQRYSHIVDPRTGLGLTARMSVTLLAPDCATADALATAVCVMGPERGWKFVESQPELGVYLVWLDTQGQPIGRESERVARFDRHATASSSPSSADPPSSAGQPMPDTGPFAPPVASPRRPRPIRWTLRHLQPRCRPR